LSKNKVAAKGSPNAGYLFQQKGKGYKMGDKGKKDKGKRAEQKKSQQTPKEKRKQKKDKTKSIWAIGRSA